MARFAVALVYVKLACVLSNERHGDGSFVLTKQIMSDMIVTRKVIICPGRREKSQAREFTM